MQGDGESAPAVQHIAARRTRRNVIVVTVVISTNAHWFIAGHRFPGDAGISILTQKAEITPCVVQLCMLHATCSGARELATSL